MSLSPIDLALALFQRDTSGDQLAASQTATPGVFYHGSANVNITAFRSTVERFDGIETCAIFFTQNPAYAARYAAGRASQQGWNGGRVYAVDLITRNPFYPGMEQWLNCVRVAPDVFDRHIEAELIREAKAAGFDAIVPYRLGNTIHEIIVLDDSVVRPRCLDVGPLIDWLSPQVFDLMDFYQSGAAQGPDYAAECVRLFKDRRQASPADYPLRRVKVRPRNPIYCEQAAWPQMSLEVLRDMEIGVLVDPRDGSALAIDRDTIHTLNRSQARELKARAKRYVTG